MLPAPSLAVIRYWWIVWPIMKAPCIHRMTLGVDFVNAPSPVPPCGHGNPPHLACRTELTHGDLVKNRHRPTCAGRPWARQNVMEGRSLTGGASLIAMGARKSSPKGHTVGFWSSNIAPRGAPAATTGTGSSEIRRSFLRRPPGHCTRCPRIRRRRPPRVGRSPRDGRRAGRRSPRLDGSPRHRDRNSRDWPRSCPVRRPGSAKGSIQSPPTLP